MISGLQFLAPAGNPRQGACLTVLSGLCRHHVILLGSYIVSGVGVQDERGHCTRENTDPFLLSPPSSLYGLAFAVARVR